MIVQVQNSQFSRNIDCNQQFTLLQSQKSNRHVQVNRVLPNWLQNPLYISRSLENDGFKLDEILYLDKILLKKLKANQVQYLFPVQEIIIPHIISEAKLCERRFSPRDLCVATPTGSGKTLAYVLPILKILATSSFVSLKALIILPVTELALQVYNVFKTYADSSKIQVGQAFGSINFGAEQESITKLQHGIYKSNVHVLVATPGRLLEHINKTKGLDFSDLRFLVLDEADKLLSGEVGETISKIQNNIKLFKQNNLLKLPPYFPEKLIGDDGNSKRAFLSDVNDNNALTQEIKYSSSSLLDKETDTSQTAAQKCNKKFTDTEIRECFFFRAFTREIVDVEVDVNEHYFSVPKPYLQRLLFSATLSHDPTQLQNIQLHRPILFTTKQSTKQRDKLISPKRICADVARPVELTEQYVVIEPPFKPLLLHHLLEGERKSNSKFKALVFTNSIEITSKVFLLLKYLAKDNYVVEEFSSNIEMRRKAILKKFLSGNINVLISTDAMARGMDVPGIELVISYDVPSKQTYVHRIGRTARAGRSGRAISVVTNDELKMYQELIGSTIETCTKLPVHVDELRSYEHDFKQALDNLKISSESCGKKRIKKTLKRKKIY